MKGSLANQNDNPLLNRIGEILTIARQHTVQSVNTILVKTYWEIGREIVEHEMGGKPRAEYGKKMLRNLAKELTLRYGRGFSYPNLQKMRQFFNTYEIVLTLSRQFKTDEILPTISEQLQGAQILSTLSSKSEKPIMQTLSAKSVLTEKMLSKLSWSHISLLMAVSDTDARSFYEIEIANSGWSVRETKRQIESMLFE